MNPPNPSRRLWGVPALLVAAGLVLSACASPPPPETPPLDLPDGFSSAGGAALPERWWTALDDPVLDGLVARALDGNFDLAATWSRLVQARATARKQGASMVPSLDLEVGASGSKRRQRAASAKPDTFALDTASEFELGLSSSYEVDLWGRVAATADAAALDAEASLEDLRAASLSLSGEVAKAWYLLVERRGQVDLLERQLTVNEQVATLIDLRFRRGQVSATDVLQQRRQVESVRGDLATARANAALSAHALAILLGRVPGREAFPRVVDLPPLPPLPTTGVPSELIKRRPDLRRARAELLAADRRVTAAVTDQYPVLSLTAGLSTSAENAKDLFSLWLANLAAGLAAPLIDGGSRAAEVDRTRAMVDEKLNAFGQSVLDALGEVEDALHDEARRREYADSLEKQLDLSAEVIRRMRDRYSGGNVDYISVLDALETHQDLERAWLTAKRQLLDDRIDLCLALAGGWTLDHPDPDREETAR